MSERFDEVKTNHMQYSNVDKERICLIDMYCHHTRCDMRSIHYIPLPPSPARPPPPRLAHVPLPFLLFPARAVIVLNHSWY